MKALQWYKDLFGYDQICNHVYKAKNKEGKVYWVKAIEYNEIDPISAIYNKTDFDYVDFVKITEDQCHALGEFMCGASLHGQFLGSLFEEIARLKKDVDTIKRTFRALGQDM